jgi:mono/diheme cytochrome c family protein
MHRWDDAPIFTRLFAAPLIGALSMVVVLMILAHTFIPSPKHDPFAVQERYKDNWNDECSSWLRSHRSNRWYCASPSVSSERVKSDLIAMAIAAGGAAPSTAPPPFDITKMTDEEKMTKMKEYGAEKYAEICSSCHQPKGEGLPPNYPPLANSDSDHFLDKKAHVHTIIKGLSGAIVVNGVTYGQAAMPPQGALSDFDIAAIATYERNAWGNEGKNLGMVLPEDVAALR